LDFQKEGEKVKVYYNVRGRSWTNPKTGQKDWFNSLSLWKIESLQGQTATQNAPTKEEPAISDELPF
jgi:translation initiation factor IF-3